LGCTPDYIEAVWLMMQQKEPGDYVIATGQAHSVQEFAEKAFDIVGLDWQEYVRVDKRFFRPLDVPCLVGDYSKARKKLGWEPKVRFDELVRIMVEEDLKRWERWLNGERFPWDAPNYPSEARILSRALRM
jgi:GDPmannose 4,6-dehydratase